MAFRLSDRDLHWLVGILEGEGCFDLHRNRYPRIRVAMTDRDIVGRVASLFGSSIRLSLRRFNQPTWHAEIQGERAAEIMEAILPHMGARRSQKIAQILAKWRMRDTALTTMPGPAITRPPGIGTPATTA